MTSTLTTVPLAKIKPREGFNPRHEFANEQMAERVLSLVGDCAALLTTSEFLAGKIAQALCDLRATHASN